MLNISKKQKLQIAVIIYRRDFTTLYDLEKQFELIQLNFIGSESSRVLESKMRA